MWQLYLIAIVSFLYFAIYNFYTKKISYWQKRNVASLKPAGIYGNMKDVILRKKNIAVTFKEIYDSFPEEKVVGFYRMTTPCLLIRDLDIIKNIMIKDFDNFSDRGVEFSKKGLGKNLFHADGESWRALRSRFTPIFSSGKLKNMFHLLNDRSDLFIDYIKRQEKREHDVRGLIEKYTVSTIAACAFGLDIDATNSDLESLMTFNKFILTPSVFFDLDMMFPGFLKKLNLSLFPPKVKDFFYNLVTKVKAERKGKPSDRNDFMDLILQLKEIGEITYNKTQTDQLVLEITDDIIAAQAFVFYVAGYETSATTVSYLLYHIALELEIQDKMIKEIDEVTQAHNGKITYEALHEMKYLDKVLDETLRVHAIVDPLQRVATSDYPIPGTNIVVKKGQIIFVSATGIHYDEKYYPNPEIFDPERFDPELVGQRHSCAYLPLGTGPRNCIGGRFGKLQSKLCVAKLLSQYRLEPSLRTQMNLKVDADKLVVGPGETIYLNFVPRF